MPLWLADRSLVLASKSPARRAMLEAAGLPARFVLRIKHELGITMVWIEHDMQMIADLADRIHVLDYGRTLAEGSPSQVLSDPKVIAAYLGAAFEIPDPSSHDSPEPLA